MSIIFEDLYNPGDTVMIVEDIYDEDTGELRLSSGTFGEVSGIVNPEYIRVALGNDQFFNVYVLNLVKKWDNTYQIGDPVQATKDIFDQVSHKVIVTRGSHGTVSEMNAHDWVKVDWNINHETIGVHLSEIKNMNTIDTAIGPEIQNDKFSR